MKLIIVESPTKARTIAKFLGKGYTVESSFGHVRDLPKSTIGIDIEHGYTPKYITPVKARKTATKLKTLAKKAEQIILASDEDREGEAIAWHLATILDIKPEAAERIVFHEITKDAITHALKTPRALDIPLVNAQQARRVLDRLVGYELSPFLWKKVARGLSAGRVQSVALRLIVEREREITAFNAEEYWTVGARLATTQKDIFSAELTDVDGKRLDKFALTTAEAATAIIDSLKSAEYSITAIDKKQSNRKAPAPFRTSTLQQTANQRLGWSAKQTMMVAQKLYEKGFITYMRTDSQNLSEKFLNDASDFISNNFGDKYHLASPRVFKGKAKGAQEAHEAIRPTEAHKQPQDMDSTLDPKEIKLYGVIWSRSIASQMPDAIVENTSVSISAANCGFTATGQTMVFDGFLKIYPEKISDNELPILATGEKLSLEELTPDQHFTKPPARYSDATLVKELEKKGIGRPSTYAPTIATLETRNYIERNQDKRLQATAIAFVVTDLLVAHFPEIVDLDFTAKMEKRFDKIASGKLDWIPVIDKFYKPFHEHLEEKTKSINKEDIMPEETTDEICDKCQSPMIIKTGRFGRFLACSNFPDCKNTRPVNAEGKPDAAISQEMIDLNTKYAGTICDKCQSPMAIKSGRFGPFLACSNYPKCKNIKNIEKVGEQALGIKCPVCTTGDIVPKKSRFGIFYACSNYPDCKNAYWSKPTGAICPQCKALIITNKKGGEVCSNKACGQA